MRFTVGARCYSLPVADIIKYVQMEDFIMDLDEMGIKVNNIKGVKDKVDVILWVDPLKKSVKMESGAVNLAGDYVIEDTEDFIIAQNEIDELLDFEECVYLYMLRREGNSNESEDSYSDD